MDNFDERLQAYLKEWEEFKDLMLTHRKLDNLQQRIDKAVEYLEKCNFDNAEILIDMGSEYTYEDGFKDELLNILKGDSDEKAESEE